MRSFRRTDATTVVDADVVGKSAPAAVTALRAKGFDVQTVNVASKKRQGTVLAETPGAGERVARGPAVTIRVSRGLVSVPDVLGQPRDTAIAVLRGAGLKPKAFVVPSPQKQGVVVAQNPQAGKRVAGARGAAERREWQQRLCGAASAAGLVASGERRRARRDRPAPGCRAEAARLGRAEGGRRLRTVRSAAGDGRLAVAFERGDGQARHPNPVERRARPAAGDAERRARRANLDPAAARARLAAAGFEVQTLQQPVTDRAQVGKVVDEQPAGATPPPAR